VNDLLRSVLADKGHEVFTVPVGATALAAVEAMNVHRVGAVLIESDGETVGIFTERDVLTRVVARRRDPASTPVSEVMTREVAAVGPTVSVRDAMAIMTERRCRHLPVVDGGRLIGLISAGDLARWANRDREVEIRQLIEFITGAYPA
jgi:CBS domain-containing protein